MRKDGIQRNSGLELARIICMFFIVLHHYAVHGGYPEITYDTISIGYVFIQIIGMFGRSACTIFALISAFFLIDSSGKNHYRRMIPLLGQMVLYSAIIGVVLYCVQPFPVSVGDMFESIFPIKSGNWYVLYYCIFYVFVPFINKGLRALDQSQHKKLVIVTVIVWSVIPTLTDKAWSFGPILFFLASYIIGAYIKLYVYGKTKRKNTFYLWTALSVAALIIVSVVTLNALSYVLHANRWIHAATYFMEYNTLPALAFSVFFFLYFANVKWQNKTVNAIASHTLGVYLIHDHFLMRRVLWEVISPNASYMTAPYLHILIKVLAVFAVCFLIDWVRHHTFGKRLERWFFTHCDGWLEKLKKRFKKNQAE